MTADDAGRARIALLLGELRSDRRALGDQLGRLEATLDRAPWLPDEPILAVVAVALHHFYSAAEAGFERIARTFEGPPSSSERWHSELLFAMGVEVPLLRPAVLGQTSAALLREALAFRHFFRHAYAVPLDPHRLEPLARRLLSGRPALNADLDAFEAFLLHAVALHVGDGD